MQLKGMVILKLIMEKNFTCEHFLEKLQDTSQVLVKQKVNQAPSIYKMIEEICEENELVLVKVKIYESGEVLRANLYFTGKKDLVLRNYRASDAMALAAYYKIPILVRKNLLKESMEA